MRGMARFRTFDAFWIFYLREHAKAGTRALHYAGTSIVILCALAAVLTGRWGLFILLPVAGYGFAWLGHFAVEGNRPATFAHPLWSLAADFRMWGLWVSGRLRSHLDAAGVGRPGDNGGGRQ